MLDTLGPYAPLYFLAIAVAVVAALVRGVPVAGRIVSLASAAFILILVFATFDPRGRLDPYLAVATERLDPYFAAASKRFDLDPQRVEGGETRIRMSPDGHFWVRADIDGVERRMLVDSGATVTAVAEDTAREAQLAERPGLPVVLSTANGSVPARTATVDSLRLGNIKAGNLTVVVSPAFGRTNVIGMNFLSRLKSWRVEGRTLILVPNNPQPAA
jgi:aspartyl protease family protein